MPVTPLHFSVGAPIHKYASWPGFILANIVADLPVGLILFMTDPKDPHYAAMQAEPHHVFTHTLWGALIVAAILYPMGKTRKWLYGVLAGALSHPLLDGLYHPDVSLTWFDPPGWMQIPALHSAIDLTLLASAAVCVLAAHYRPAMYRDWR